MLFTHFMELLVAWLKWVVNKFDKLYTHTVAHTGTSACTTCMPNIKHRLYNCLAIIHPSIRSPIITWLLFPITDRTCKQWTNLWLGHGNQRNGKTKSEQQNKSEIDCVHCMRCHTADNEQLKCSDNCVWDASHFNKTQKNLISNVNDYWAMLNWINRSTVGQYWYNQIVIIKWPPIKAINPTGKLLNVASASEKCGIFLFCWFRCIHWHTLK